MSIPVLDPQVKHVGVSHLRKLNADTLRGLEGALVICDNTEPLAVVVSYEMFLRIQRSISKSIEAIDAAIVRVDNEDMKELTYERERQ